MDLLELVKAYSVSIKNGRSLEDILLHLESEVVELEEEIQKERLDQVAGSDGIVGESVDVILCALDAIFVHNPDISKDEILEIARRKCEKWKTKYATSPAK